MKKSLFILSTFISFILVSCASGITVGKNAEIYEPTNLNKEPRIEFIGFKADTNLLSTSSVTKVIGGNWNQRTITVLSPYDQWKAILANDGLRSLGSTLQNKNLAIDQSFAYFGIYSLQELELYRSALRYVTFVEVAKNKYSYVDSGKVTKNVMAGIAGGLLGGAIPLLIGGVSLRKTLGDLTAETLTGVGVGFSVLGGLLGIGGLAMPVKCTISFEGIYNIYIYDTKTKSIIRKEIVNVNSTEEWNGTFESEDTNIDLIHSYYSQIVANALLKKYDELNLWINTLE